MVRERQRTEPNKPAHQNDDNASVYRSTVDRIGTLASDELRSRMEAILSPGLYLKRWLSFLVIGVGMAGLGLSLIFGDLIPAQRFLQQTLMLNWLWGAILLLAGFSLAAYGGWRMNRTVASMVLERDEVLDDLELMDTLISRYRRRKRKTGPKIVVIGGGTGMPTLLRGLRRYSENITAVVTVADDGGSSGRLRQHMGVLPPGDFRNNIAALSDAEGLMTQVLQYRFGDSGGLGNHNFGNLFITTMAALTGSFEAGIAESSRILAVRGRILPSTLENVALCAEIAYTPVATEIRTTPTRDTDAQTSADERVTTLSQSSESAGVKPGTAERPEQQAARASPDEDDENRALDDVLPPERLTFVRGESQIPKVEGRILRVHLEPENCRAYPETVRAILAADLIIAAPGSFFTSLMPNLLVPYVQKAIRASQALRLYVCNVATQKGETEGFSVSDHMWHLRHHAGDAFPNVLANNTFPRNCEPVSDGQEEKDARKPEVEWVTLPSTDAATPYRLFTADVIETARPWRHSPDKVAAAIMSIYQSQRKHEHFPSRRQSRFTWLPFNR